jgi:LPXTG-motif cell wall-anchored protein
VDNPTLLTAPLNATLAAPALVGDTRLPVGATITLPAGTAVLGSVEPNATVLLRSGTAVQVQGRTALVGEPVPVVISPTPVAQPARLPATGDADPVLWPAVLGLGLLLVGWRLRRTA